MKKLNLGGGDGSLDKTPFDNNGLRATSPPPPKPVARVARATPNNDTMHDMKH